MKVLLGLCFTLIICINAYSQMNIHDVIVLKKGIGYKGQIIERQNDEFIIMQTRKKGVLTIPYQDIAKVIQRPMYYFPQDVVYLNNRKKYTGHIIKIPNNDSFYLLTKTYDSILIHPDSIKKIKRLIPLINKPNSAEVRDFVFLKNGDRMRGVILKGDGIDKIALKIQSGDTLILDKEDVLAVRKLPADDHFFLRGENKYASIGPGIGISYGGIGWRFQQRFGNMKGFGYHFGLGFYPNTQNFYFSTWLNAGLKYYWYKWFYLDMSAGTIKRIHYQHIDLDVYGVSLLVGGDYFFKERTGLNIALGISSDTFQSGSKHFYFNADIGFIIKFKNNKK